MKCTSIKEPNYQTLIKVKSHSTSLKSQRKSSKTQKPQTPAYKKLLQNAKAKSKVNITGRVTIIELPTTIKSNEKTLIKKECTLTDETGSLSLVLWEEDTKRIQSGNTYRFCNTIVKSYQNQKYVTLNKQTSIHLSTAQIHREDAIMKENPQNTVTCPAEAVERLTTYLSCTKCNSSLPSNEDSKILSCSIVA